MLSNEVACTGVQGACEKGGEDEVVEGVRGGEPHEGVVEENLRADVHEVYAGERDLKHEHGSYRVENDLEGAEEGLPEDGVEEEGFGGCRKVGIETVDAKRFVVCEMVWLFSVTLATCAIKHLAEHVL